MKKQTKRKVMVAKLLEKIGNNFAIEGAGDPTHWAFYEFDIPESVKDKAMKKIVMRRKINKSTKESMENGNIKKNF